jgi:hypothetical protein
MANYRRGSNGPEVEQIQVRLTELGLYHGPLDGDFGGGTETAVRAFQRQEALQVDGVVGPGTWGRLFDSQEIPEPAIVGQSLAHRCLALTGTIETGRSVPECFAGLSGDFDGQGISFGALQWNLGQGSLQPLLVDLRDSHPGVMEEVFGDHYSILEAVLEADQAEQLDWARSIQDRRFRLFEPWRGLFKTLGRREEYQDVQVKHAGNLYNSALRLCEQYGVWSERAVALMFDIKVQNGSISSRVRAEINKDFAGLDPQTGRDALEVARLKIVANRRAEAANPRWVEDVRRRKLTIAEGEGVVHGNHLNLEEQYGIRLTDFAST